MTSDVEWEVLPPEKKTQRRELEPLFKWLALIMDDLLRVPGTKFRFGLDPLIGLIPGLGDTGSMLVSSMALIAAVRHGIPKIILARMSLNILINEGVGIVPIFGDAFSFWFKSNARNYELLKHHLGDRTAATRGDWIFVGAILLLLVLILIISVGVSFWAFGQFAKVLGLR
jgi:hypothetical protein